VDQEATAVIPLYGFLAGDVIGVLVLADERDTMAALIDRLQEAASVRVAPRPAAELAVTLADGRPLPASAHLDEVGLQALDRFDVVAVPGRRA
jgi:hypothetical protein